MHKDERVVWLVVWRASVHDWLALAQAQAQAQSSPMLRVWEYIVGKNFLLNEPSRQRERGQGPTVSSEATSLMT